MTTTEGHTMTTTEGHTMTTTEGHTMTTTEGHTMTTTTEGHTTDSVRIRTAEDAVAWVLKHNKDGDPFLAVLCGALLSISHGDARYLARRADKGQCRVTLTYRDANPWLAFYETRPLFWGDRDSGLHFWPPLDDT